MPDGGNRSAVLIFSGAHFLVDLSCIFLETAFLMPAAENRAAWFWCVLVYNFFAFACQLPVGMYGDRQRRPWLLSGAGCFLVAGAYGLTGAAYFLTASSTLPSAAKQLPTLFLLIVSAVAGIGNSCFHVGGGIDILNRSAGNAAMPGVFVSTGAFGVFLGPVLAANSAARAAGLMSGFAVMLLCGWFLSAGQRYLETSGSFAGPQRTMYELLKANRGGFVYDRGVPGSRITFSGARTLAGYEESGKRGISGKPAVSAKAAVLCLTAAVMFRSYAGTIMGFGWKKGTAALLFTAGIVLGKMLGGVIGDRIGWTGTAAGSLALSGGLFLLAEHRPLFGILAVFLFNMTMPLTLSALARMLRGAPGTAFGLTTLALFLGTLPSMAEAAGRGSAGGFRLLPAVCAVSIALMVTGLKGAGAEKM